MCEPQWYPLAELYLHRNNEIDEIYCLCSRVLIRNNDDNLKRNVLSIENSASDDEEPLVEEEILSECSSLPNIQKHKAKQDIETETVSCASCYCSASHTDNLSTDEHDSIRDSHESRTTALRGLQSSDSGADLTECVRHDLDVDWQKFWSLNGEKLIWQSWIMRYSAYINPNYLTLPQKAESAALTLELEAPIEKEQQGEVFAHRGMEQRPFEKQQILIRTLSGSDDKLNIEVSEGWNPLSPVSVDCETDFEHLLSSRCGSHVSSLRTVDSMTNVTRMTISPLELSDESAHSSESFSSVSSVQSSLSSTSSEENEDDYQHQWNVLWKKHYEEECLRQYEFFVTSWKEINVNGIYNVIPKIVEQIVTVLVENPLNSPTHSLNKHKKKNLHSLLQAKQHSSKLIQNNLVQSLGSLLNNLRMSETNKTTENVDDSTMEESKGDENDEENAQDKLQMEAMGLPTRFGVRHGNKEAQKDEDDCNEADSDRKRFKSAFKLFGVTYEESDSQLSGRVSYKMKHIRLQNRYLNMRTEAKQPRLGDESFELAENKEKFQSVLPTSDDKLSSEDEMLDLTNSFFIEENGDDNQQKRKKRKRKTNTMPQEIKENNHLKKYWNRRFDLFLKFDEGIKLDEESWYSVTPQKIAMHIAKRCACDVIIDGFCGAGGNTIQFAMTCKKVIAIDIDPKKIELARNNAEVYGVADRIEFIVGDFFQLADTLKADVVFFSPPWGGPSYLHQVVYDLDTMLLPVPITQLLAAGRKITNNLAVFLPKNSNSFLLIDCTVKGGGVEIEQNFMRKSLVAITAYYNNLIKKIQ